jgi:hypothetical protein
MAQVIQEFHQGGTAREYCAVRRDRAYSIFYMDINLGALLG